MTDNEFELWTWLKHLKHLKRVRSLWLETLQTAIEKC